MTTTLAGIPIGWLPLYVPPSLECRFAGEGYLCHTTRLMRPGRVYKTILFPGGDYDALTCKHCQRVWRRLNMGS